MWPWQGSLTQASQHGNSSWSRSLKPCDQSLFKEYLVLTLLHVNIPWFMCNNANIKRMQSDKVDLKYFPAIQVFKDVTWVMSVSLLLSSTTVFVLVTFQLLNCWTSSLISAHTGLAEARWLAVLLSSIISPEEHIYILYDYPPPHPLQVRGHYLNSLDLHDTISNLFRLDEPPQNVNLVHILHSQEGSSASPGGLLCQSL